MPRHLTRSPTGRKGGVGRDREKMQVQVRGWDRSLLFQQTPWKRRALKRVLLAAYGDPGRSAPTPLGSNSWRMGLPPQLSPCRYRRGVQRKARVLLSQPQLQQWHSSPKASRATRSWHSPQQAVQPRFPEWFSFPCNCQSTARKKTPQSPAGPEYPCQGGSRLCSTAVEISWDAPRALRAPAPSSDCGAELPKSCDLATTK